MYKLYWAIQIMFYSIETYYIVIKNDMHWYSVCVLCIFFIVNSWPAIVDLSDNKGIVLEYNLFDIVEICKVIAIFILPSFIHVYILDVDIQLILLIILSGIDIVCSYRIFKNATLKHVGYGELRRRISNINSKRSNAQKMLVMCIVINAVYIGLAWSSSMEVKICLSIFFLIAHIVNIKVEIKDCHNIKYRKKGIMFIVLLSLVIVFQIFCGVSNLFVYLITGMYWGGCKYFAKQPETL